MRVQLFYFDRCPNWVVADKRLKQALDTAHHSDVVVERQPVETAEEAELIGFTGSPTILVDGRDPFATGDEQIGLACRVYTTPDGLSGSPTIQQLTEMLT